MFKEFLGSPRKERNIEGMGSQRKDKGTDKEGQIKERQKNR